MAPFRTWLRRLALLSALALGLGILALGILYWLIAPRLPDVQELRHVALQVPLSVYSSDGKLIAQFGETRRYPVEVEKIPLQVKQAFIAIEDARFYQHQGLDFRGIGRAIWLLATTDDTRVPGGSTITQQVAKNFYLSSEYSYSAQADRDAAGGEDGARADQGRDPGAVPEQDLLRQPRLRRGRRGRVLLRQAAGAVEPGRGRHARGHAQVPFLGKPHHQPRRAMPSAASTCCSACARPDSSAPSRRRAARAELPQASPHEPKIELDAPYIAEMVRRAMQDRYGAESETSGFRVLTTVRSSDQIAANVAVRKGLLEYDRRHGWRGAEAQVDLPADEDEASTRKRLRQYQFISGMPTAIVTRVGNGTATVLRAVGEPVELTAASSKWTGRTPASLLKRGDVVRLQAGTGDKAPAFELTQIPKAEAALVSLRAEDGALAALVGGFSFARNQFNRATQAQRQPGSSFKPFLYAAAIERGLRQPRSCWTRRWCSATASATSGGRRTTTASSRGRCACARRMVQSRNLVSVRLLDAIGVDFARKYITQFGFKLESLPPNLSMSLGTASLTPMSVARGYAVFANGGFLVEPYFIAKVLDRNGVVVALTRAPRACRLCPQRLATEQRAAVVVDDFDFSAGGPQAAAPAAAGKPDPKAVGAEPEALAPRAIDERTAFLTRSLMLDVVMRGTATAAKVIERADIGGKTGSTNDHRDAWFSGFGGNLATTVWVGRDDFESLGDREYGGKAALPIWIGFMGVALKDVPLLDPTPPTGIVTVAINRSTGNLLPEGTPGAMVEYMKSEDYDRIISGGYNQSDIGDSDDTQSYDIF